MILKIKNLKLKKKKGFEWIDHVLKKGKKNMFMHESINPFYSSM